MPTSWPSPGPILLTFTGKDSRHISVQDQSGARVATLEIGFTGLSFKARYADGSTITAATKWWAVPSS